MISLLAFFCSILSYYHTLISEVSVPKGKKKVTAVTVVTDLKADLSFIYNNSILYVCVYVRM